MTEKKIQSEQSIKMDYKDPNIHIEDRVQVLPKRMTIVSGYFAMTKINEKVETLSLRDSFSSVNPMVKKFKEYKKFNLMPGETKTFTLEIIPKHLSFTQINKMAVVEPKDFEIMVD